MKIFKIVLSCIWLGTLFVIGMLYFVTYDSAAVFSETENRTLADLPAFNYTNVISGNFGTETEAYLLDHFPARNKIIAFSNRIKDAAGFASYKEYLAIQKTSVDTLDNPNVEENIDELLSELLNENKSDVTVNPIASVAPANDFTPTASVTPVTDLAPAISATPVIDLAPTISVTPVITVAPTATASPSPTPTITPTPTPKLTLNDFPIGMGIYMDADNAHSDLLIYNRNNIAALTAVLNKYAAKLNNGGRLVFTMVPQSVFGNQYYNSDRSGSFYSDFEACINALSADNVTAVSATNILGKAMKDGQYVYFRTDMHWTPFGTHLVYSEMAHAAGITPTAYEDFEITVEEPFLGTYYRDNPTSYMKDNADYLELLSPRFDFEWRRINGKDSYTLIDFLDFNAKSNDRYTVYLGGPAGPWTYTNSDNGADKNCLVITDSFGLSFIPMLTGNYKQVHYYDPRYFSKDTVGYSVAEMIELYNITDCYVVIGDLHSFDSSFLIKYANDQLE